MCRCKGRGVMFLSQISRGLSLQRMPTSSIFLHLFCYATLSCWLQIFRSLSVVCVSFSTGSLYMGSDGYVTPESGPLRRVSTWIPSFAKGTSFHCWVYFSHDKGGVIVAFSQEASMWRGFFASSADCAMLCCRSLDLIHLCSVWRAII